MVVLLLLAGLFARGQGTAQVPTVLQSNRTVTLPLNKAQVAALVRAAWDNSFGLDPGARLEAGTGAGNFEGLAHFNFRSADLNNRERSTGQIQYRVTVTAENGSCLVRVHSVVHKGNAAAKGGAVDLGTLRETPPADLVLPGLSRTAAARLHNEARDVAMDHLNEVLGRFEATLRARAEP